LQRGFLAPTYNLLRTVKSRGPDIPMLIVNLAPTLARRAGDGGQKARCTRENAKQPLKPSRREGRIVRLDLWYLPPAFFSAGGPRASVEVRPSLRPLF